MPIYEYRCTECGFQKEFLQKVSDPRLTTCTSCGKETFQKMLTAAGFQLKGSGWYATDFKNSGNKPTVKADDSSVKSGKTVPAGDTAKAESSKAGGDSDSGSKSSESSPAAATPAKSDSGSSSTTSSNSSNSGTGSAA